MGYETPNASSENDPETEARIAELTRKINALTVELNELNGRNPLGREISGMFNKNPGSILAEKGEDNVAA